MAEVMISQLPVASTSAPADVVVLNQGTPATKQATVQQLFNGAAHVYQGTGAPTLFAPNGSMYLRLDGTNDTTLYLRVAGAWKAAQGMIPVPPPGLTPEQYGAAGDGVTDDTTAFQNLANAINAAHGGTISLGAGKTYLVGRQTQNTGGFAFQPANILTLAGLTQPLKIYGNNAKLKLPTGLRFGSFDSAGNVYNPPTLPFWTQSYAASLGYTVHINGCSGTVEVYDLEVDGTIAGLILGGQYGDTGRQLPAMGLVLQNNSGQETVQNVYLHHHGTDGLLIDGVDAARVSTSSITNARSEYNARQGVSHVGGHHYTYTGCNFNNTGQAIFTSSPGAGLDIEAEGGKTVHDNVWNNCTFNNQKSGVGMVANSGPSNHNAFNNCTFVGTTSFAIWPEKPYITFDQCTIVGAMNNLYGGAEPGNPPAAVKFTNCTFSNDPTLSPTGQVYMPNGRMGDVSYGFVTNVTFTGCTWNMVAGSGMQISSTSLTYTNCTMHQATTAYNFVGTFSGTNTITGPITLHGSVNNGTITLNGVNQPAGTIP